MSYSALLENSIEESGTCLCVGIDPRVELLPEPFKQDKDDVLEFSKSIVEATGEWVCAFKPNHAFFAAHGLENELADLIEFVHYHWPTKPVILDAKRGDIGSTSEYYAKEAFDRYEADAVTVSPFLGWDCVEPFLERPGKGVYVLCRTSNLGSFWLQDQPEDRPIYMQIAEHVHELANPDIGLVVGATLIEELRMIRSEVPNAPLLIPGVGAQGGVASDVIREARSDIGYQFTINVSRGIIHQDQSNRYLDTVEQSVRAYSADLAIVT